MGTCLALELLRLDWIRRRGSMMSVLHFQGVRRFSCLNASRLLSREPIARIYRSWPANQLDTTIHLMELRSKPSSLVATSGLFPLFITMQLNQNSRKGAAW